MKSCSKETEDKMIKMVGNVIEGIEEMRDSIFKRIDGYETVIKETGK